MLRVLTSRARNAPSYQLYNQASRIGLSASQIPVTPPILCNIARLMSSLDTSESKDRGAAKSGGAGSSLLQTIKKVLAAANAAKAEKAKSVLDEGAAKLDGVTLRRLWEFARPEIVPLSVSVATLGITTGISLLFPYAIGQILDVALKPDAILSPTSISLGLLGLFVVQSGMITLRSALLTISGERIAASIRKDLFQSIVVQETAWFDKNRTGDIINRLSSDTAVIQKALTVNIASGLRAGAMVLGGAGMLFYLSPSLALLSLGLIPPVALAGMYYGKYLQGQQKAVQEALGRTTDVAEEIISAMRTVRQFARETNEAGRFAVKVDDAYQQAKHIGMVAAYFDGLVHMAANVSLIAVLWYGGNQVWTGAMSAGDLTAFLMYSLYTGFNISNLSSVYTDLKRAAGAATRVIDITDREPTIPISSSVHVWDGMPAIADSHGLLRRSASPHPKAVLSSSYMKDAQMPIAQATGNLEFRDVLFRYPTRPDIPILDGFSLRVAAGQHIAVVGRSGSGKSTVGALLTRLYDPERGTVFFDGVDIRALDPMMLRSNVGVVSQEPTLFATSVLE
jgi:ABC-type multidrug transport system fused ATPase/permease subunit